MARLNRWFSGWTLVLVGALACQGEPVSSSSPTPKVPGVVERSPSVPLPVSPLPLAGGWELIPEVAARVLPSVVNVSTQGRRKAGGPSSSDPFFRYFFGQDGDPGRRERSLGSGVVVGAGGIVLTNNHVVDGGVLILLTTSDGREVRASLVGSDPKSDLAVLRAESPDLPPLPLGDSGAVRIGEAVLAVGDPFGVGQTVTFGIVSAVGRANVGISEYEDFIQTDAAINPGNSGGALVNLRGELIGVNTAILSKSGGYQGVGFAIPSNMVAQVRDSILTTGKMVRGYLGVSIADLEEETAQEVGLHKEARGVVIGGVGRGSAAERAGMKEGDVVLTLDGKPLASAAAFRLQVSSRKVGSRVAMEVWREGEKLQMEAVLDELPSQASLPR